MSSSRKRKNFHENSSNSGDSYYSDVISFGALLCDTYGLKTTSDHFVPFKEWMY